MLSHSLHINEEQRLRLLHSLEILDTPEEIEFNEIVQLVSQMCGVPICSISLLDRNRQWLKASIGQVSKEVPLESSFCTFTILSDANFLQVNDTTADERFANHPLVVNEPHLRFYAGAALVTAEGYKLGSLCVADTQPNSLSHEQICTLKVLSRQVVKMIEIRMANKQLEKQSQQLKQRSSVQKQMLHIIENDVKNPLHTLKSALKIVASANASEADKKINCDQLSEQLDNTLMLLNNLLDWGKMQVNTALSDTQTLHLKSFAEQVLTEFQLNAIFKNNRLLNLVDNEIELHCDKVTLHFIIRNLISNANKFTNNGLITVYAHKEEKHALLTVSDTGAGMDGEQLKTLFSKSYHGAQVEENKSSKGIGLLLVKDFIDKLGGTIHVASEVGKGTTVYIYFPI
ncbi:MAG: GAF domain-containing protein [Bacteroidota bacterium]|nr:GAF domain-containing protein [Bacteroidota bacterium]